MTPSTGRVLADELLALVSRVFEQTGMTPEDAHLLADTLVQADLGGTHSHGVLRVPEYVAKLTRGGVNPRGRPRVVRDEGACLVVDGGNSMGAIGAHYAMRQAIARARELGIGAVAIRGSNHCGAMGYYAAQALSEDMIGLATTNALPTMAPIGGAERIVGINPLAYAIPTAEEPPLIYDAAFSGSSHGKLRIYQQKGQSMPEGWALDRDGQPTTDASAAVDGLLMPIGGYKGVSLALLMGLLSSMLSGAAYGTELGDLYRGPDAGMDGHFMVAVRISAFEDVARFKARVDAAIREMRSCRRAPGVERIYVPGEKEALNRAAYRQEGIPLNPVELADLARAVQEVGLEPSAYAWLR
jgi:LDH2 family malate/lactate/ureidoglycolate dehydrogenase